MLQGLMRCAPGSSAACTPPGGHLSPKVDNIGRNAATLISRAHSMHNMCLVLAKRFDVAPGSHELCKNLKFCWALNYLALDRSAGVQPRPVLAAAEQVYTLIEPAASFSKRTSPSLAQAASSQASVTTAVAEWIPQPSDQLLPDSCVTSRFSKCSVHNGTSTLDSKLSHPRVSERHPLKETSAVLLLGGLSSGPSTTRQDHPPANTCCASLTRMMSRSDVSSVARCSGLYIAKRSNLLTTHVLDLRYRAVHRPGMQQQRPWQHVRMRALFQLSRLW